MGDESDNEGHENDANGMGEKGRDSFTNSATALATGAAGGYGVGEYVDHGYGAGMDPAAAAGYYGEHMYGGQYGVQTSPGGNGGYADAANPYGVDPYAHAGMAHPQQQSYQNHY